MESHMARELMVEEYKSLKREQMMLAESVHRWQMIGIVSAGVAIALVVIFGRMYVAFATLPVIAGCILGIIRDMTVSQRISAYLQAFLEGQDTGAQWDQRIERIGNAEEIIPLGGQSTSVMFLLWVGLLCALISAVPFLITLDRDTSPLNFLAIFIPLAWARFWAMASDRISFLNKNGVKSQTLEAFYDSLKRS